VSFKFRIGLTGLCEDCPKGYNPRDKDDVFLKLAWITNKELVKMGVVEFILLTYDY